MNDGDRSEEYAGRSAHAADWGRYEEVRAGDAGSRAEFEAGAGDPEEAAGRADAAASASQHAREYDDRATAYAGWAYEESTDQQ
ncbi:hypothetical protein [Streptomyces sp. NPDC001348]